ncbi:hypothetical protein C8039_12330 [Halogeometricum sp. wsp3]|nr:hypothetical protein C8039_12330 [Halogeometricum sp. wsp3]
MKLKILKKHARKAGVNHCDVTFTRMRKSSASYLLRTGIRPTSRTTTAGTEDHVASRYDESKATPTTALSHWHSAST